MKDAEAARLLAGVDAPRPLPARLQAELVAELGGRALPLTAGDAPRALPEDLRARLEATLVRAPASAPTGASVRARPRRLVAAAAAVLVVLGALAIPAGDDREPTTVAGPEGRTTAPAGEGPVAADGAGGGEPGPAPGAVPPVPFAGDGTSSAPAGSGAGPGGDAGAVPAPAATAGGDAVPAAAITVAVTGGRTMVAEGFEAYLRALNGAGGIGGRRVVTVDGPAPTAVATVNLGTTPLDGTTGVVFETAFVGAERLRGEVVSLASPLEAQAVVAVAHAFPKGAEGARVAVYESAQAPWREVAAAFEAALRQRGATPVRVPFNPQAPTFLPTDAAFLSLSPEDVRTWVHAGPAAPRLGSWAVGSAWDDALAGPAAGVSLRVLSPYAPVGGDEQAALASGLPAGAGLSAGAVHGWVTAKALAVLLAANGGTSLTGADLDRLVGFEPGWAPAFEVRPGTRARTLAAIPLRPGDGRFVVDGRFERAR